MDLPRFFYEEDKFCCQEHDISVRYAALLRNQNISDNRKYDYNNEHVPKRVIFGVRIYAKFLDESTPTGRLHIISLSTRTVEHAEGRLPSKHRQPYRRA